MITFLLFLIILVAITLLVLKFIVPVDSDNPLSRLLSKWSVTKSLAIIGFSVLLILVNMSIFFAKESHQYYVLSPTGQRTAILSPGFKIVMPGSVIQEWSKYLDIKAVPQDAAGNYLESTAGLEGVLPNGVKVMFIDRATADIYISARFELPADPDAFINIVEVYKTSHNLVMNTLIPTINEQLTNVSFMYSADDYVSGGATDFKMTIEDALKNGGFVVRKVEVRDTLFADETFIGNEDALTKTRQIREIRTLVKNEKVTENGIPKRIPHEINANQVLTAQVIVADVVLESQFTEKLRQQRDISAEKIIEIQKIETARAAQQRIVAEGERDKAAERVTQEKDQVSKLIAIETLVKEEESKRQLAEIAVKTAELNNKAVRINADAEAYKNQRMVQAGLTPQEIAEWDYKKAIGVAAEFAKMKSPEVIIMGGSSGAQDLTGSLIQAEMAKQLLLKPKN